MLYNNFGVIVALSAGLCPFMILSLFSVMRGIDRNLFKASSVCGASTLQTFFRVLVPLSAPGISAGCLLTFIMTAGTFVVPALLGGPRQTMVGQLVEEAVTTTLSYNFASALSLILVVATLLIYLAGSKVLRIDRMITTGR
jgi:putative spermidine/putrescine transport system permease protein